jgi:GNAT superfamily N-acetyltransferase
MRIDRLGVDAVDRVLPLLEAQFEGHAIDLRGDALRRAVRGLVEIPGRGAILAAEIEGKVVGVAVLAYTWTLEHGGLCTWLDELFVEEAAREKGVGTALLHQAMKVARADGCAAMDLEVDRDHARVESLYAREGFTSLPRRRFARKLTEQ